MINLVYSIGSSYIYYSRREQKFQDVIIILNTSYQDTYTKNTQKIWKVSWKESVVNTRYTSWELTFLFSRCNFTTNFQDVYTCFSRHLWHVWITFKTFMYFQDVIVFFKIYVNKIQDVWSYFKTRVYFQRQLLGFFTTYFNYFQDVCCITSGVLTIEITHPMRVELQPRVLYFSRHMHVNIIIQDVHTRLENWFYVLNAIHICREE